MVRYKQIPEQWDFSYLRQCIRCNSIYRTNSKYSKICLGCQIPTTKIKDRAYSRECRRCGCLYKTRMKFSEYCFDCYTPEGKKAYKVRASGNIKVVTIKETKRNLKV